MAIKNPVINADKVITKTVEEVEIIQAILGRESRLRSSKPDVKIANGKAAYVWRYVAFFIGRKGGDSCMPVMAYCDIKSPFAAEMRAAQKAAIAAKKSFFGENSEYRELIDRDRAACKQIENDCMDLVKRIVDVVPVRDQTGTLRWGKALGKI